MKNRWGLSFLAEVLIYLSVFIALAWLILCPLVSEVMQLRIFR